jgi:hypothetical protein
MPLSRTKSKIERLSSAILSGQVTSPLRAWKEWGIAANTYHVFIHRLGKRGYHIQKETVHENGVSFKKHWIDVAERA